MQAFYGGRAEVNIRRMHLPVAVHDFTSMYPSVNSLMGLWSFLIAERIDVLDTTAETQSFLAGITLDGLYDPSVWRKLTTLVLVQPDGDILPVRGKYSRGGTANIGVNPLWSQRQVWYTLADVVASKLLSGRTATITKALHLSPSGTDEVRSATLTGLTIDPLNGDFFRSLIELRKQQPDQKGRTAGLLKVLANSGSYGIFSEFNAEEHPPSHDLTQVAVWKGDARPSTQRVSKPEIPGGYCFPPIAAFITGAARLMLAIFETEVVRRGGVWTFCDTDSLSVVSTETGGLIPCPGGPLLNDEGEPCIMALPWATLAEIRARFDTELNPYDRALVPSLVKLEGEKSGINFAVSAKRYTTYRRSPCGDVEIVDAKEHGLGHVRDPRTEAMKELEPVSSHTTKWTDELWLEVLRRDLDPSHHNDLWAGMPALKSVSVSSPHVMRRFKDLNRGKAWEEQVKPFNFVTTISTLGEDSLSVAGLHSHPVIHSLIAPFIGDPAEAVSAHWITNDGTPAGPVAVGASREGYQRMQCMDTVVSGHALSLESKFLPPSLTSGFGMVGGTTGLLRRTPTIAAISYFIGKEANEIESIAGLLVSEEEATVCYFSDGWLRAVLPILRKIPISMLVREITRRSLERLNVDGVDAPFVSVGSLRRVLKHGTTRIPGLTDLLLDIAETEAIHQLSRVGIVKYSSPASFREAGQDDRVKTVVEWEALGAPFAAATTGARQHTPCRCGCGNPAAGRSAYANQTCRKRVSRSRLATS